MFCSGFDCVLFNPQTLWFLRNIIPTFTLQGLYVYMVDSNFYSNGNTMQLQNILKLDVNKLSETHVTGSGSYCLDAIVYSKCITTFYTQRDICIHSK
jgi:hypothetical protein